MIELYRERLEAHMLKIKENFKEYPKLAKMFEACFMNTIDTTVEFLSDQSTFIITGDIAAMWLRDSAAQVHHYLEFVEEDPVIYELIKKVIDKQFFYINMDPYANAFNAEANGNHYAVDESEQNDWEWERKYEIDSLCYPVNLAYELYMRSNEDRHLDEKIHTGLRKIVEIWKIEQHHMNQSKYRFQRDTDKMTETLSNDGLGAAVSYTGMTWAGFRPSDDACTYGYLVPANMFASVVLNQIQIMAKDVYCDMDLFYEAKGLKKEIDTGIEKYGMIHHDRYGLVYAYEVDGKGNYLLMDDANIPSLLSMPYIGYCDEHNAIYTNTRKMLLSEDNPYYFNGNYLNGIGSPHSKPNHVWPLAIIIEALTTSDSQIQWEKIEMLLNSDNGTGYIHESIHMDDPSIYTRSWFAWANSLFSELVIQYNQNRSC